MMHNTLQVGAGRKRMHDLSWITWTSIRRTSTTTHHPPSRLARMQTLFMLCNLCPSQVAAGLKHMHDLGLAHMDIKPENIYRAAPSVSNTASGALYKVGDFGLATPKDGSGTLIEGDTRYVHALGCDVFMVERVGGMVGRQPWSSSREALCELRAHGTGRGLGEYKGCLGFYCVP